MQDFIGQAETHLNKQVLILTAPAPFIVAAHSAIAFRSLVLRGRLVEALSLSVANGDLIAIKERGFTPVTNEMFEQRVKPATQFLEAIFTPGHIDYREEELSLLGELAVLFKGAESSVSIPYYLANSLIYALDSYARVGIGQLGELLCYTAFLDMDEARYRAMQIKVAMGYGLWGAGLGIGNESVGAQSRCAWDLKKVLEKECVMLRDSINEEFGMRSDFEFKGVAYDGLIVPSASDVGTPSVKVVRVA